MNAAVKWAWRKNKNDYRALKKKLTDMQESPKDVVLMLINKWHMLMGDLQEKKINTNIYFSSTTNRVEI